MAELSLLTMSPSHIASSTQINDMFMSPTILYANIISNMNDMDKYIGSILWDNLAPVEMPALPFL